MRNLKTLQGKYVRLEPIRPEDVSERYVGWLNDPEITRHTEARHSRHSLTSVLAYVILAISDPNAAMWRIVVDGAHIGNIRLSDVNFVHRRASVALLIGETHHRGVGHGAEAVEIVARYGLEDMGLNKVTAGIYRTNIASRRAFEKAGFEMEAVLRRHAFEDGMFVDVLQMARFATP